MVVKKEKRNIANPPIHLHPQSPRRRHRRHPHLLERRVWY